MPWSSAAGDAAGRGGGGMSHFGLALPFYTHFTSPIRWARLALLLLLMLLALLTCAAPPVAAVAAAKLSHPCWPGCAAQSILCNLSPAAAPNPRRRYADVVVHRQLLAAVAASGHGTAPGGQAPGAAPSLPPPLPGSELAERAAVMNERHRTAKRAQKKCSDLYLLLLLHAQVGCAAGPSYGAGVAPSPPAIRACLHPGGRPASQHRHAGCGRVRSLDAPAAGAGFSPAGSAACATLPDSNPCPGHGALLPCSRTWRRPLCTACAGPPCSSSSHDTTSRHAPPPPPQHPGLGPKPRLACTLAAHPYPRPPAPKPHLMGPPGVAPCASHCARSNGPRCITAHAAVTRPQGTWAARRGPAAGHVQRAPWRRAIP